LNYIEMVKVRLRNSKIARWFEECTLAAQAAERAEAGLAAKAAAKAARAEARLEARMGFPADADEGVGFSIKAFSSSKRDRTARRSLDNSHFGLPDLNLKDKEAPTLPNSDEYECLPRLGSQKREDPMERRRAHKAESQNLQQILAQSASQAGVSVSSKSVSWGSKQLSSKSNRRSFNGETEFEKTHKSPSAYDTPPSVLGSYADKASLLPASILPKEEPLTSSKSSKFKNSYSSKSTRRPSN